MKPYLLFIPNRGELATVSSVTAFLLKRNGSVQILDCIQKREHLKAYLDSDDQLQLMICDATAPGIIPVLEQLRVKNQQMRLVILADDTVSPVHYIRPSIMPSGLLWRPIDKDSISSVLGEVISTLPKEEHPREEQEEQAFSLEIRGVIKRINYKDILFFESRNKRVYLHQSRKETAFNSTLEHLVEELPPEFIRVHKSFIINRSRVMEIQFSQNQLLMEGGMMIPISRSYRAALKAVFS